MKNQSSHFDSFVIEKVANHKLFTPRIADACTCCQMQIFIQRPQMIDEETIRRFRVTDCVYNRNDYRGQLTQSEPTVRQTFILRQFIASGKSHQ